MNNNAWFKKEKPLLSLQSMGGGASGTLMQGAADKTYAEDVFSSYVYKGNGSSLSVANGIDNSGKGGMVWTKSRASGSHIVTDTVRGAGKGIVPNASDASSNNLLELSSFNSDGFSLGSNYLINDSGTNYASWNWRVNKGFFDVVQYTGNGSAGHQVAHSLGCEVGFMMVKRLENSANWSCYHRDAQTSGAYLMTLNSTGGSGAVTDISNDTAPTSTHFTLGTSANTNGNGETYVCYLFAGGESTAATARSVDFDGNDYIKLDQSTDTAMQTEVFTIEAWVKPSNLGAGYETIFDAGGAHNDVPYLQYNQTWVRWRTAYGNIAAARHEIAGGMENGQWYHIAVCRHAYAGKTAIYVNGTEIGAAGADTYNYASNNPFGFSNSKTHVGVYCNGSNSLVEYATGSISNFRIVKGTALYTASFRPPTEPLTNITNTKLLCCNNSSTTGSTITPETITAEGDPTANTSSPFDDTTGFKFGEEGNQNLVKCSSYKGTGSSDLHVHLGWEPQFLLWKESSGSGENWFIHDNIRGWDNKYVKPNSSGAESDSAVIKISPTGFIVESTDGARNHSGETYVYMAIRRPDGYVGKPPEAGTDVFTMDVGHGGSTSIPTFDSGFPVDLVWMRQFASTGNNSFSSRFTGGGIVRSNASDAETSPNSTWSFDWMDGWNNSGAGTDYQSWMWKRGQGFDMVTWVGDDTSGRNIPHSMNAVPEMMWIKRRNAADNWTVYHKGANGGTDPADYFLALNDNTAEANNQTMFYDLVPTATHFFTGENTAVNYGSSTYINFLFASVDGISKVGYYTGTGVTSGHQITLGFQPRFLILKGTNGTNWWTFDTLRGWNGSSDKVLNLDNTDASASIGAFATPNATGFNIVTDGVGNGSGINYIYYAHA